MIIATSIMNKNNLKFAEGFDLISFFFWWICFCACWDWKQCWMSRSQDPSRSRSPPSIAVLLPPLFKLQSDWILHKLWWHKWVSTGNQWSCWSTNASSFSSFFKLGGTRHCSFWWWNWTFVHKSKSTTSMVWKLELGLLLVFGTLFSSSTAIVDFLQSKRLNKLPTQFSPTSDEETCMQVIHLYQMPDVHVGILG